MSMLHTSVVFVEFQSIHKYTSQQCFVQFSQMFMNAQYPCFAVEQFVMFLLSENTQYQCFALEQFVVVR